MEWTPPDPPLRTGKLVLRPFEHRDVPAVVIACADEEIVRHTFMVEGADESGAIEWIDRSNEWWSHGMPRFAITDVDDDQVLGQIGLAVNGHHRSAEAFYWVLAERRGQGVASAALGLVADWAFALGVERLFLLLHTDNDAWPARSGPRDTRGARAARPAPRSCRFRVAAHAPSAWDAAQFGGFDP